MQEELDGCAAKDSDLSGCSSSMNLWRSFKQILSVYSVDKFKKLIWSHLLFCWTLVASSSETKLWFKSSDTEEQENKTK